MVRVLSAKTIDQRKGSSCPMKDLKSTRKERVRRALLACECQESTFSSRCLRRVSLRPLRYRWKRDFEDPRVLLMRPSPRSDGP